jgi:hypothetical protein
LRRRKCQNGFPAATASSALDHPGDAVGARGDSESADLEADMVGGEHTRGAR